MRARSNTNYEAAKKRKKYNIKTGMDEPTTSQSSIIANEQLASKLKTCSIQRGQ